MAKDFTNEVESLEESEIDPETYKPKILALGNTGAGKSTLGATFAGKKLLIDYDGRADSLIGFPNIKVIKVFDGNPTSPKAWTKATDIRKWLWSLARRKDQPFPYSFIMEGGLTSMGTYCMYHSLLLDPKRGLGGSPGKQHYGPWIKYMGDHIRAMHALPCGYFLEGHLNFVEDENTSEMQVFPKVFGRQFKTELPSIFNEVWLCHKDRDPKTRKATFWVDTEGSGIYNFFRSALNRRGLYWTSPVSVDLSEEPAGISKLLQLRFGKKGGDKD